MYQFTVGNTGFSIFLVEIEPRAFRRLTNLVELDLSENAMREVPSEAWKYTKALMRLNLSGNPIKLIR